MISLTIPYLKSFTTSIVLSLVKAGLRRLLIGTDHADWCWLTASSSPIATQTPLATIDVDKVLSMGHSEVFTTTLYDTANYRIVSYSRSLTLDSMMCAEPECLPK